MVFDIPFVYDMEQTHLCKQKQINQNTIWGNRKCQEYNYSIEDKVLIVKDGKLWKTETLKEGPHEILQMQMGLLLYNMELCRNIWILEDWYHFMKPKQIYMLLWIVRIKLKVTIE